MRRAFVPGILGMALVAPHAPPPPQLSLKDVVQRAESYVAAYGEQAAVVVCTERYTQETSGSDLHGAARRTLLADFAIVRADAVHAWLGFRDVLEVDGRQVADRQDRLARVLIESQGGFDEARRLTAESSRFNIGNLERNFNVPTAALFFFVRDNHDRFKFRARRVADDGTWEIAFEDTGRPTMIRTPDGDPVASSGTIWVRPEDGVVVRTELLAELLQTRFSRPQRGHGRIDVRYRYVEGPGMWLPASMDESFEATRSGAWERETGHAEYSDYRRFTTSVRIK